MGPLHPLYEEVKHQIQDHLYPYADTPFETPPLAVKPKFKSGHDVAALKHNIMTAHAFGLLFTGEFSESLSEKTNVSYDQYVTDVIIKNAASYAQYVIDEHGKTLKTVEEIEEFDSLYKAMYRQIMAEYIASATPTLAYSIHQLSSVEPVQEEAVYA